MDVCSILIITYLKIIGENLFQSLQELVCIKTWGKLGVKTKEMSWEITTPALRKVYKI